MKRLFIILLILTGSTFGQEPYMKPMLGKQIDWGNSASDGLIAIWLMNEGTGDTVYDLSGNNLNGTASGSYSWGGGKFGTSWIGDGDTNQIVVTSNESAGGILNPSSITIVAWVITNTGSADQDIAGIWKVGDAANQSYLLWIDQPVWEFLVRETDGTANSLNSSDNVVANEWTQVVATCDITGNARLYINSVIVASTGLVSGGLKVTSENNAFYISERLGAGNTEWNGTIDHVMLFNRAWTADEVASNYAKPFGMFEDDLPVPMMFSGITPSIVIPVFYYHYVNHAYLFLPVIPFGIYFLRRRKCAA